jgi:hypothetical protein
VCDLRRVHGHLKRVEHASPLLVGHDAAQAILRLPPLRPPGGEAFTACLSQRDVPLPSIAALCRLDPAFAFEQLQIP